MEIGSDADCRREARKFDVFFIYLHATALSLHVLGAYAVPVDCRQWLDLRNNYVGACRSIFMY